jgi:hypothetical protein
VGALDTDSLYTDVMPDLLRRAFQAVKLAERDGFEAADEQFEIERRFYAF